MIELEQPVRLELLYNSILVPTSNLIHEWLFND